MAPIIVKIGGARAVEPAGTLADVARLTEDGMEVVVVHGGSTAVDEMLERLGMAPEYVETPGGVVGRFTNAETMAVFTMVFGRLNTELVAGLQELGVNAVGCNGVSGRLLVGPRKHAVRVVEDGKQKIRRGDHSGRIETVNTGLIEGLLGDGYTLVTGPPMLADDGVPVNTDADRASAAIAGGLGGILVSLTDVEGVYRDPDDASTVIERVADPDEYDELETAAAGFMRRKVMAASEALEAGAERVIIASANADSPVLSALDGGGTHVLPEAIG